MYEVERFSPAYRFGQASFNPATRQLLMEGEELDLEPLTFNLIEYLIENRTRVVSKDELFEHVWGSRCLSDTVLPQAIMKARRAVGDDARNPAIIKTVHRIGYRFVAHVSH